MFQYPKVRLKVTAEDIYDLTRNRFQYPKVRLKATNASFLRTRGQRVSIPEGAIEGKLQRRHIVHLRIGFNTRRCD